MPSLVELDITVGVEPLSEEVLQKLSSGPIIRVLTLRDKKTTVGHPASYILHRDRNPFPHLHSLCIRHPDRHAVEEYPDPSEGPNITLSQLTVEYHSVGDFLEVPWLVQHSKHALTHLSLISSHLIEVVPCLSVPEVRNILSLTLGQIHWTDDLFDKLHGLHQIKELRMTSLINLSRGFPTNLPDTIEHLVFSVPFTTQLGHIPPLDFTRPALLKTCTVIRLDKTRYHATYSTTYNSYSGWIQDEPWEKQYVNECLRDHIDAQFINASDPLPDSLVRVGREKDSFKFTTSSASFEPTTEQLKLVEFDIIKRGPFKQDVKIEDESPSLREDLLKPEPTKMQSRSPPRSPLSAVRDLLSSWKGR